MAAGDLADHTGGWQSLLGIGGSVLLLLHRHLCGGILGNRQIHALLPVLRSPDGGIRLCQSPVGQVPLYQHWAPLQNTVPGLRHSVPHRYDPHPAHSSYPGQMAGGAVCGADGPEHLPVWSLVSAVSAACLASLHHLFLGRYRRPAGGVRLPYPASEFPPDHSIQIRCPPAGEKGGRAGLPP